MEYTLLILLLPMLSFLGIGLMGRKLSHRAAGITGTLVLTVVTLLSYLTALDYFTTQKVNGAWQAIQPYNITWLNVGERLHIDLGILLDPISVMMLVVISTVSFMVHIYSLGYMKGEKGFQRYYSFLSLFTFSMMGLVLSTNIFQMYIFWELVGVSSYLLIGFYYTKPEAVAASKKAFIVTRFADLFFLIGILLLSFFTQTFDFEAIMGGDGSISSRWAPPSWGLRSHELWHLSLLARPINRPSLHIWLPDAIITPVSALIHAATMVVAGVFLVARLFPIYIGFTPEVLQGIAYVGAFTALFSAIIAMVQTDIKRVLAFSTISQIGFMMVALGVSTSMKLTPEDHGGLGYMASMFHLFTHAMFKSLLFLGAGSIIHAIHSNDMKDMGGLRKHMPITHVTFLIACLAIAGIPPLSGFVSKDEIVTAAYQFSTGMGIWMTVTAGFTAFYMFRLYFRIFWGKEYRGEVKPKESPRSMTYPLIFLALITLLGGFIPFGQFVTADGVPYTIRLNSTVAIISVVVALVGIGLATLLYRKEEKRASWLPSRSSGLYKAAYNRFYIDEAYLFVTKKIIFNNISRPLAWFDRHVIDGAMNGLAWITNRASDAIKGFQSGSLQWYAWVFLLGTLLITLFAILL